MYTELLGWIATVIIGCSFFVNSLNKLKIIQLISAVLWAVYGLLIHSKPVLIANILVMVSIFLSSIWKRLRKIS
jgi:hypothetical protein